MSESNQKPSASKKAGRSGDVEARQTDDGSFELVMGNGSQSESVPSSSRTSEPKAAQPATPSEGGLGARKVAIGAAALVVGVGAAVWAFTGDEDAASSSGSEASITQGFQPYVGAPGDEAPSAEEASARAAQPTQEPADQVEEPEEPAEPERESKTEIIVLEEGEEPYDDEEVLEEEDVEEEASRAEQPREVPKIDTSRFPQMRERLKLPIKTPQLQRLPAHQIEKMRRALPDDKVLPAPDGPAPDSPADQGGADPQEQEYYDDQAPEYGDEEGGLNEYEEGN